MLFHIPKLCENFPANFSDRSCGKKLIFIHSLVEEKEIDSYIRIHKQIFT